VTLLLSDAQSFRHLLFGNAAAARRPAGKHAGAGRSGAGEEQAVLSLAE
jgi:hypothetical protein